MFSLGTVLYELLTGRRPFLAQTVPAMLDKVLYEDPPPPSVLRPALPAELDAILLKVLSKAPAARFSTWADFALELAKVGRLGFHDKSIADSDKYDALRRVEMLRKLDDAQIWELVLAGRWTRLPAQTSIIRENDPGQSLFFLAKGQAKATRQGRLLNLIGTGECFGEMGYIRGGETARQASVDSLTEVTLAEFDAATLEQMSPGCQLHFMRALVRTLVERLEFANVRISQTTG
jgi:hypothetical protein